LFFNEDSKMGFAIFVPFLILKVFVKKIQKNTFL
jgi:hypothetical protein